MALIILYHYDKTKKNSKLLEDPEFINWNKEFNNQIKEKNNEDNQSFNPLILNLVLSYSNFFDFIYIMKNFLINVDKIFIERFGKLELTNIEDKLLFEAYIHFLVSYKFEKLDIFLFGKKHLFRWI